MPLPKPTGPDGPKRPPNPALPVVFPVPAPPPQGVFQALSEVLDFSLEVITKRYLELHHTALRKERRQRLQLIAKVAFHARPAQHFILNTKRSITTKRPRRRPGRFPSSASSAQTVTLQTPGNGHGQL